MASEEPEVEETEVDDTEPTEEGPSPWDRLGDLIDSKVAAHVGALREEMQSWQKKTSSSRPSSKGSQNPPKKEGFSLEAFVNSLGGKKRE